MIKEPIRLRHLVPLHKAHCSLPTNRLLAILRFELGISGAVHRA
jgi:hypothetical protein